MRIRPILLVTILALGVAYALEPYTDTLSPELKASREGRTKETSIPVIVQFKAGGKNKQQGRARLLSRGAVEKLDLGESTLFDVTPDQLEALATDPSVEYVSPDREVKANLDLIQPTVRADVALANSFTGKGIGVAIIDSGITMHGDLGDPAVMFSSRIVYQENFVAGETTTEDLYGHGTHVAGIVGGNGASSSASTNNKTFRGIATGVNIINLRVLNGAGVGTDSQVVAAINRAIALKDTYNIRVINLSLGRAVMESYKTDPLGVAVEKAVKAGIVVVVAAGNYGRDNTFKTQGYGLITSPGNHPRVITVGAMKTRETTARADDEIASYSSKGPTMIDRIAKPDLVAPGNRVASLMTLKTVFANQYPGNLIPLTYYTITTDSYFSGLVSGVSSFNYFRLSGTSMSTPVVSGAVALMLQKDPALSPDTVKARLMKTATKTFPTSSTATDPVTGITYVSQYDLFTVGAGYLDVWAAMNSKEVAKLPALSPAVKYDTTTKQVYFVKDTSALWGSSAAWGSSAVWGSYAFTGATSATWGSSAVWGSSALWGSSAAWGSSALWGSSAAWGSSALWGSSTPQAENLNIVILGEK